MFTTKQWIEHAIVPHGGWLSLNPHLKGEMDFFIIFSRCLEIYYGLNGLALDCITLCYVLIFSF